ncbi:MAG: NlpC/P60 family protein [Clostridiaceae bacterium]
MKKNIVAKLLIGTMIFTAMPQMVFADETEIDKTKAEISIKTEAINKSQGELSILDNKLIDLKIKIDDNNKSISEVSSNIADVQKELVVKEEEYAQKQEDFATRLRVVYKAGNISMIQTLMQSQNFSDFLVRLKVVNAVMKEDAELVKALDKVKDELTAKRGELDSKKAVLVALVGSLTATSNETKDSRKQQSELIAKLNEEKSSLYKLLAGQEDKLLDEVRTVLADGSSTEEQLEDAKNLLSAISDKITVDSVARNAEDLENKLGDKITAIQVKLEEEARVEAARLAGASSSNNSVSYSAPSSGSGIGYAALEAAKSYLGVPYVYGGSSYSGMDCSGLTSTAYRQAGISIPRTATAQYYASYKISRSELIPGDLIFWGYGGEITHVTMYAGNGMTIHAPSEGYTVCIVPMLNMQYIGAGRPY